MEIICFFAGIAFIYTKSIYPLLLLLITLILWPSWSVIVWFLAAIGWGLIHLWWVADTNMPAVRVLPKVRLEGTISSLPISNPNKTQLEFYADHLNGQPVNAKLLLACYQNCPLFTAGQRWLLEGKLKRPENLANPGHVDFVSGLEARHINWTGYIKKASQLSKEPEQNLLVLREKLASTFAQSVSDKAVLGILQALTLGVVTNIDQSHWELFRRTGTTHLMVISGSHIGLIVGFCYWIIKRLWSFSRLCLYCPANKAASIVGIIMGFIYALLAGFAPPSQRSLLACFFLLLRNFISRRFSVWQAWRYGLLGVLLYEPHAVLLPGFYLSFIAVAILILINQRFVGSHLKKALYVQVACLLGLMPLTLYWFSYGAINGFFANVVAIPLVGFLIVPLALISLFFMQFLSVNFFIDPVYFLVKNLLYFLHWIDSFSLLNVEFSFNGLLSPLALMLAMLLILFMPIKAMIPAIIVLSLAGFFPAYQRVKAGNVRVDFLDVGQGLAAVITTAKHSLIYDTGMKFFQGGDMGKLAVIPYLNTRGIKKLDKVIISHPDLDHRGGLASLEEKYVINEFLVDNVSFYRRGTNCHQYPEWQWDDVSFRFLAIEKKFRDKNNSSCVLQISNSAGKLLLTGDIERLAENYLLETYADQLQSEVLLIPHHGSKTSSSVNFIRKVAPRYAIISFGFANRYRFPHQQTLKTLINQKIPIYSTAQMGMITVELDNKNKQVMLSYYKDYKE